MFAAAASVARAFGGRGRRHFSSGSSPFKATARDALERLGVVVRFGAAAYVVQVYVANSTMVGRFRLWCALCGVCGSILTFAFVHDGTKRCRASGPPCFPR